MLNAIKRGIYSILVMVIYASLLSACGGGGTTVNDNDSESVGVGGNSNSSGNTGESVGVGGNSNSSGNTGESVGVGGNNNSSGNTGESVGVGGISGSGGNTGNGAEGSSSTTTPMMPIVSVSYGVKQLILSWGTVNGSDYYRVKKNPDGHSGYTQVGNDLTTNGYVDTLSVHLIDWANASYLVEACNHAGCSASNPVGALDSVRAIGYVKASNAEAVDHFGDALALSGDGTTLAVGAPSEDSAATGVNNNASPGQSNNDATSSGAVYLFVRNSDTGLWAQQAYLKASNTDSVDVFGGALSLSYDGNVLAIGAHGEDSDYTGVNTPFAQDSNVYSGSGAVYVFVRSGATWSQQAYVKASNTGEGDNFGRALSLSGDGNTIAVGTFLESSAATGINNVVPGQGDNSATSSGAVYVFVRDSITGSWSQQAYVKASNTNAGDQFGRVALSGDGNTLVVGAPQEDSAATGVDNVFPGQSDNSATDSGAVYVFVRSGAVWAQQSYIKASNAESNDWFGHALALSSDGNTLAVGAFSEDSAATGVNNVVLGEGDNSAANSGAVYVFVRSGAVWSQQAYVKASNSGSVGGYGDLFGFAVALTGDGNTLAVGAREEDSTATGVNNITVGQSDNSAFDSGAAYVFVRSGTTWSQQAYVKASNTRSYDWFGVALSLSSDGGSLAVGANDEDSASTGINNVSPGQGDSSAIASGAVYIY